jgi:NADPH:quinone reductase-like Zn-dependent oxidoreductase
VNPQDGCFAEYAVGLGFGTAKLPKSWSITDGSTLGVSVTTVGQGLYQSLGLPLPEKATQSGTPLLIYGGSTATGIYAIQYAKLSGCKVAVTCSPHNFELVKSLGADAAFDYSQPDVGKKIREYFQDNLVHAFDTITNEASTKICSEAIGSKGGKYSALQPSAKPREDVEYASTLAYTATGKSFQLGERVIAEKPEDAEYAAMFWKLTERLMAEGKLKPIATDVREGGLERILDGLQDLRTGKVSGKKIVYVVDPSIK